MILFDRRRQARTPAFGCLIALIALVVCGVIALILFGVLFFVALDLGADLPVQDPQLSPGGGSSAPTAPGGTAPVTGEWTQS